MALTTETTRAGGRGPAGLVLGPAVALMNRLSYARKFALIGLLLLTPFAVVSYLQISLATERIDFNQKESYGVAYITPLREMLRQVQLHRLYTAAVLSGQTKFEERLTQARAKADQAAVDVDAQEARFGVLLQTTKPWTAAKKAWSDIKAQRFASADQSEREHDQLTAMLTDIVLNYAGNYSNLILDPDLDSYWLMDAFIIKLPTMTETVGKASLLSAKGQLGSDDRIELAGLYRTGASLSSDLVNVNMATVFKENKSGTSRPALEDTMRRTDAAVTKHLGDLRTRSLAEGGADPFAGSLEALVTQTAANVDEVYRLWEKVGPELDRLILARVANYQRQRILGLTSVLVAIALLVWVFFAFYRSVQDSVVSLRAATGRMIAGTKETFSLAARDELGQVADSYNEINAALLQARDLRARVEQENRDLQSNILSLLRIVSDAADGKLHVRASVTEGALGNVADALNQMLEEWQQLIAGIGTLVQGTRDATSAIATSTEAMAQGAGRQAQEIVDASGAVRRMAAEVERVSGTASTAATAARRAQDAAREGATAVQDAVRGMDDLRAKVQAGAKKIKALGDRSMEITGIVGTIAKISDQTNMLALNAAIEAARAGEHGRGFSVVADQVRQLAERTAAATQEIGSLVRLIQTETNESVEAIEQQTTVVEEESRIVSRAGQALLQIQEVSTHSAELIADINEIAKQQVTGAAGVATAIEQLSEIASRTEAGAGESLRNTRELAALSERLQKSVNQFELQ
ncbi:MAG: methyl-accepting chemotaxis protein [Vicinamibacteria bacterium]